MALTLRGKKSIITRLSRTLPLNYCYSIHISRD